MARWLPLAALIGLQIAYPLTTGGARTGLVLATVALGWAFSTGHALLTRGPRTALLLVAVTTAGGFAVEALGVHTGFPFGQYGYADLGPALLGVPLVVPLAWTWMAWPAWLGAARLTARRLPRIGLAGLGLAAWDLFLDPQMVAAGYWSWAGTDGVPLTNYAGWLGVSLLMMAVLSLGEPSGPSTQDAPMYGLYLWTYGSSVLAHAVFLHLPGSALWGALGMGLVAIPLAIRLVRA